MAASTLSHHITELVETGLITQERQATALICRAHYPSMTALIGYHLWCYRLMSDLRAGRNRRSPTWYRVFNEVPALLLIAIVILAVVKPF